MVLYATMRSMIAYLIFISLLAYFPVPLQACYPFFKLFYGAAMQGIRTNGVTGFPTRMSFV
jgi:hypothetical protein